MFSINSIQWLRIIFVIVTKTFLVLEILYIARIGSYFMAFSELFKGIFLTTKEKESCKTAILPRSNISV